MRTNKGKAIIGIAMAAIMIASVFVAMVPTTSAAGGTNVIDQKTGSQKVLIGQKLDLSACNVVVGPGNVSISRVEKGEVKEVFYADSTDMFATSVLTTTGTYYVNWDSGDTTVSVTYEGTIHYASAVLAVSEPTTSLKLKATSAGVTKEVTRITQGTKLITAFTTNLFGDDVVDLVITGPSGRMHTDEAYGGSQNFDALTVSNLQSTYGSTGAGINTTNWKVGTYTFQIKTKSEHARGLTAVTEERTLTIGKPEIDITADSTSVVELTTVKLTVTGKVDNTIQLSGPKNNAHVIFPAGTDDNKAYDTTTGKMATLTIDADGQRVFSVKFDETGSYTITVTDITAGVTDTVDITVSEKKVDFDLPITVVIGEKFTIEGTSTSGTTIDIYVDDVLYKKLDDLVLTGGEFSEEVTADTTIGLGVPGTVRLKAWIDAPYDTGTADKITTVPPTAADGDAALLLVEPGLTAEIDVKIVAQEDSFYVEGTAEGSRSVDIITVAPKGASGTGMEPSGTYPGLAIKAPSVSEADNSFSQKITVDKEADTGTYLVGVFAMGRDGHYGTGLAGDGASLLVEIDAEGYGSLAGKTQEQLTSIFTDLVTSAGVDDLYWYGVIKVEAARITLDPIADVGIGEPLVVSGTTNREAGHTILVTVKGPVELAPQTCIVEAGGTFNVTVDTSTAQEGTYTVKADDGDGHTDDATVNIGAAPTPTATPAPTATPTATPVPTVPPTVAPTATPTAAPTPTPEEPGFEAVFAIAGLLAVAYLVLRIKK